jgi:hypothetical protein
MKQQITFTILLLLCILQGKGQTELYISGKVIDDQSQQPLPYTALYLEGAREGTVTNKNGDFFLKIKNTKNDTLNISYIGYSVLRISIDKLKNRFATISLSPVVMNLNEVVVKSFSPTALINKAIEKIPENYPDKAMNLTGFYREAVVENSYPIQFLEVILEIYKTAYNDHKSHDQVKILMGTQKNDIRSSKIWDFIEFVDGPYEVLQADLARNPDDFIRVTQSSLNFLDVKYFRLYNYSLKEGVYGDKNKAVYIIDFNPKVKPRRAQYAGKIYIEKYSLAFIRLEYQIQKDRIKLASLTNSNTDEELREQGVFIEPAGFYSEVNFTEYGDKWRLDNVEISYQFQIEIPVRSVNSIISVTDDFWITSIQDKEAQPFKWKDRLFRNSPLIYQLERMDNYSRTNGLIEIEGLERKERKK